MKVLIGCESSGTIREAFRQLGHSAISCDLLPADDASPHHIVADVREVMWYGYWDLAIFHPPCTRLTNTGARWLDDPSKMKKAPEGVTYREREDWPEIGLEERKRIMARLLREGAELFRDCLAAPIEQVAVENPIMHKHAKAQLIRDFDFSVNLWQFGDWETKRTCFWTKNLSPLVPLYRTLEEARKALGLPEDAKPAEISQNTPGGKMQWKKRSKTRQGIANAIATQWGGAVNV